MIMGTIGDILSAIGMCMCLLPEWNAFRPGVVMGWRHGCVDWVVNDNLRKTYLAQIASCLKIERRLIQNELCESFDC